jgi:integrase
MTLKQFEGSTALARSGGDRIRQYVAALAQRPEHVSVRELVDRFMADYAGHDGMLPQRLSAWVALIGDFELAELTSDVVEAARMEIARQPALNFKGTDFAGARIFRARGPAGGKSPATLNRYTHALGAACTYAIAQRLVPAGWAHPCRGIRRLEESRGRVRFLDTVEQGGKASERTRLLEACKLARYPRLYALVLTALLTGARRGELLGLRWRDLNLEAGTALLHDTKNGDARTLVLLPQVVEVLRPFQSAEMARLVFGSVRSNYTQPASIDTCWKIALKRAGVENFRFHDLRHSTASYLAQQGQPLHVIADVLGHRRLDMTRRYSHLTVQSTSAAMQAALGSIGR